MSAKVRLENHALSLLVGVHCCCRNSLQDLQINAQQHIVSDVCTTRQNACYHIEPGKGTSMATMMCKARIEHCQDRGQKFQVNSMHTGKQVVAILDAGRR